MRAAIYARQSADREQGIDRQLRRCTKIVEAREWELLPAYIDNDTSAFKERGEGTAWHRLLRDIELGLVDVVVAVDLDRLLRSIADLAELTKRGTPIVTVNGELDTSTANGEFLASLFASLARFEVRQKSERQLRANADRVKAGKPVPGRRRYGFETDGLTPRTEEAEKVLSLFQDFAEGASIRSLASRMGWRTGRVREVLSNPAYSGRLRSKGVVYDAPALVPIVSPELAEKVSDLLADPTRRTTPGPEPKHLASGLAVCGVCGQTMFYMRDYRCRASASHPSIQKKILDPLIAREVAGFILTEPLSTWDRVHESLSALYDAVRENEKAQSAYLDLMDDGKPLSAAARKRLRKLEADAAELLAQIDKEKAKSATARVLADLRGDLWQSSQISFADAADAHEKIMQGFLDASLEAQRDLVRGLLDVTVNPGRGAQRVKIERREEES